MSSPVPRVTPPVNVARENPRNFIPNFFLLAFTVADTRKVVERVAEMNEAMQTSYVEALSPNNTIRGIIDSAILNYASRQALRASTVHPTGPLRQADQSMLRVFLALVRHIHCSMQDIDPTVYQILLCTNMRFRPPTLSMPGGHSLIAPGQRYTPYYSVDPEPIPIPFLAPALRSPPPDYVPRSPSPVTAPSSPTAVHNSREPTPPRFAYSPSEVPEPAPAEAAAPPPAPPVDLRPSPFVRSLSRNEVVEGVAARVFYGTHEEFLLDQQWHHGTHPNGDVRIVDQHQPMVDLTDVD